METLGLFLPSMRDELNLTPVREGLLGAAPQLTVLILSIPFGLYLSRFPPKLLTLVSMLEQSASSSFRLGPQSTA